MSKHSIVSNKGVAGAGSYCPECKKAPTELNLAKQRPTTLQANAGIFEQHRTTKCIDTIHKIFRTQYFEIVIFFFILSLQIIYHY